MYETEIHKVERNIGGATFSIETGRVAKQATGSVWVTWGDTVVQVAACIADQAREGIDFFPLMIDYREKQYAAGKIPGAMSIASASNYCCRR